jgi:hypothetical protein
MLNDILSGITVGIMQIPQGTSWLVFFLIIFLTCLVWFMLFNATFNNISVISYINMSYFYTLVQVRKIIKKKTSHDVPWGICMIPTVMPERMSFNNIRYNWNIVESGVKQHKPNQTYIYIW